MSAGRFPRALAIVLALLLSFSLTLPGPAGAIPPRQDSGGGTTLRIGASEPSTIDPALATDTASMLIVDQLFAGLTRIDDASGEAQGDLAESWAMSPDATVFTFTLRSNLKWSDGSALTAGDVVTGVLRSLSPATQSGYAYPLFVIQNAEGYNNGSITDPSQVGVSVVDGTHVRFDLNAPFALFPSVASLPVARPVPAEVIALHGSSWTAPDYIVTSGAYTLESWTGGQSMRLEKNVCYWNAAEVHVGAVDVSLVDQATAWQLYLRGYLDTANVPGGGDMALARSDPVLSAQLHIAPQACTYYYGFSLSQPPFDRLEVRRAFAAAVDRQGLIDNVLGGVQQPALTFTPHGVFGHVEHPEEVGIPYSPTLASELLATAGYTDGVGLPAVTLWVNPGQEGIADYVAGNWRHNLGATVTVDSSLAWGSPYFNKLNSGTAQVWRMGWCMDYNDAYNFLGDAIAGNWSRYGNWDYTAYEDLLGEMRATGDPAARQALYEQAERTLVYTDAVMVPLYYLASVVATKPYLHRTYALNGLGHFAEWSFDLSDAATVAPDETTVVTTTVDTVAYTLPQGTFTCTAVLTHTVVMPESAPAPGDYMIGTDHVFAITAVDAESGAPLEPTGAYTMTVAYSDQEISAAGIEDEGMLALFYWNGEAWVEEPTSQVDTEANVVTATPDHFSLWAVMRGPFLAHLPLSLRP